MAFHSDLSESTRLAYLQALGIRSWYARDELPGALPSPELTAEQLGLDEPAELETAEQNIVDQTTDQIPTPQVETQPAVQAPSKVTPPSNLPDQVSTPVQSPQVNQPANTPAQTIEPKPVEVSTATDKPQVRAKPIRFACQLLLIPEQCFIISTLPQADAPGFSASQHQLMQDILFALEFTQGRPQESLFSWPLVKSGHLPQGADVARKALQALIRSKKLPDSALVLLMGREAVELATQTEGISYDQFLESKPVASDEPFVCLPSLEEMLTNQSLKRLAWQQLQQALSKRA